MKSLAFFLVLISTLVFGQTNPLTFSGYAETYYCYDLNQPGDHNRPGFIYSHNRHNEFNLNIGFLKAAYATDRVRGNLSLMAGTYANANLAAEPGVLQNIFEANAGFKLSKNSDLWVDAGIFPSHIGFESAIGKDCKNLTRGILADNSPYYESGVKIGYTSAEGKWYLGALLLNGWQRIQRPAGNQSPAFGTQITYKPGDKITLNSSTFIGNDKPDTVSQLRLFHNFYGLFQVTEKLHLTLGFDIGMEQPAVDSLSNSIWYTPVGIISYQVSEKISIAVRGEYYSDENGVIIATGTPKGFQTIGYSANLDYKVADNVLWRIEGRGFSSKDDIFLKGNTLTNTNMFFTTALAISF